MEQDFVFEVFENCGERYENMIDPRNYIHNCYLKEAVKWKPEKKNSGLNGFRTHDLCDTGSVLYQLSCQLYSWISDLAVFSGLI